MHIRDLTARTGTTERQVRYLIAEGFVPSPSGGRANADYGDDHVRRSRDTGVYETSDSRRRQSSSCFRRKRVRRSR